MRVNIEKCAWTDARFSVLGQLLGSTKWDAIARMGYLWGLCTERNTYTLTARTIDAAMDMRGFHELLLDPDVDLARREPDGTIRIKGTKGRIEWLASNHSNADYGHLGAAHGAKGGRPKLDLTQPADNPHLAPHVGTHPTPQTYPPPSSLGVEKGKLQKQEENTLAQLALRVEVLPPALDESQEVVDRAIKRQQIEEAFEKLYGLYPRKKGKAQGLKVCRSKIKTMDDLLRLQIAIENFNAHHKQKGTEAQYLPYFGTFMASWTDWVEVEPDRDFSQEERGTKPLAQMLEERGLT